jgi:hypothetical protein
MIRSLLRLTRPAPDVPIYPQAWIRRSDEKDLGESCAAFQIAKWRTLHI